MTRDDQSQSSGDLAFSRNEITLPSPASNPFVDGNSNDSNDKENKEVIEDVKYEDVDVDEDDDKYDKNTNDVTYVDSPQSNTANGNLSLFDSSTNSNVNSTVNSNINSNINSKVSSINSVSSISNVNSISNNNDNTVSNAESVSTPTTSTSPSGTSVDGSSGRVYERTVLPPSELVEYPFKTLNRILDDMKWTIPMKQKFNISLLNSIPFDYSTELSKLAGSPLFVYEALTLNNSLNYSPSLETVDYEDRNQTLSTIRGLLVNTSSSSSAKAVFHFRISILETNTNPFISSALDKHEYHIIPKLRISSDDLEALHVLPKEDPQIIDDAFFKSSNSPSNQILRVTIYSQEFSQQDLLPLVDQETIKARYLAGVDKHPSLSPETIPNVTHCFKTLIKVLRGPILMKPEDSFKTISLAHTVMDAQIDVNLLFHKLSFTLNEQESDVVPPNLTELPELKESYIRMIQELIYLGRIYGSSIENNEYKTLYSYSDNLSLVFKTISEYDKHINQVHFRNHNSNQLAFLINLSICSYFQDELIIKCFENTIKSDPANKLHYVDSLRSTINFRNGSSTNNKLNTYLKNLTALGDLIGFHEYMESMNILGIDVRDPADIDNIDDGIIIAMYKTNFKNDPKNYQYYNNHLQTVAKVRKSSNLWKFINNEIIPLNIALDELNIEEITEDDVVITAYEFKLDDTLQANGFRNDASEILFLHKALLSVAVNRKSYLLLNYIETKLADIIKLPKEDFTYQKALELFGADESTSDFEIITRFQNRLILKSKNDIDSDIRILRYCLKLIAEEKKSQILFSFLKNGKVVSSLLPAENWPAGLDNIGNTCYLNSLLQYYFCIKPLRDLILSFDENDVNQEKMGQKRKIGGRKVEELELTRSNQFVYHLRYLFDEMIHTNKRCVQPSKDLAYLSFLPLSNPVDFKTEGEPEVIEILDEDDDYVISGKDSTRTNAILVSSQLPVPEEDVEMLPSSDDYVEISNEQEESGLRSHNSIVNIHIENASNEEDSDMIILEPDLIQLNYVEVQNGPKLLPISTDQMESTIEVGRQQDVTECIENVTFQIETALEPERLDDDGEQYDLIKRLFYGKTKQTITPIDDKHNPIGKPRVSIERFFSLIINVSDHPKSMYDTLDNFFNEDIVNLEEGLAKKSITVSELPDILQFHVQRVMFDRERLMAYKSLEPIPFSEKIYFDRYLDTDDPMILRRRSEVFKWKSEIQELTEQKNEILNIDDETKLSIIDALVTTKKYLELKIIPHETMGIKPDTIFAIQEQIDNLRQRLLDIDSRLEVLRASVANQFTSYTKIGYTIFAIFIHRGEASYGHYWVYIRDPQRNIFRKYNDETVSEVPFSEVFNFAEGNTATPYYIVYVKDELENDYVDPLKRVINKC